jgi:hypothetical protein
VKQHEGPRRGAVCPTCGRRLEPRTCWNCGGKGYTRRLMVFKRTCAACRGSGSLLQCPDHWAHLSSGIRSIPPFTAAQGARPIRTPPVPPVEPSSTSPGRLPARGIVLSGKAPAARAATCSRTHSLPGRPAGQSTGYLADGTPCQPAGDPSDAPAWTHTCHAACESTHYLARRAACKSARDPACPKAVTPRTLPDIIGAG